MLGIQVVRPSFAKLSLLQSLSPRWATLFRGTSLLAALLFLPALALGQTLLQQNSNTTVANLGTVSVTYTAAETAGDLNVVVVGWSDTTSSVTSVADDNTNTYFLVGTSDGHGVSQAIYYSPGIVLPTNTTPTVTVTFNQNASFPDVRILEYSGLSAINPLDNWTGASGTTTTAASGAATTSTNALVFGAGTTSGSFIAAGAGFTLRQITSAFGDIIEDSNVALAPGAQNATATLAAISGWVMQVAGFSATAVTFAQPPTISTVTPINPTTGPDVGGATVTIDGTNFQPGAVVLFGTAPGGLSAVNCTESGGATITCLTPADSAGVKDVTVVNTDGKLSSAAGAYTALNVTPTFGAIVPTSGPTNGSPVTITGTNFQAGAVVTMGGVPAGEVVVQDPTTIAVNTPGHAVGAADVKITNPDTSTVTGPGAYTYALGTGPVNFIQRGDAATGSNSSTAVVTMPAKQAAGNLNVVIIGWADVVASVSTVADSEGNTYFAALPVNTGTGLRQVIYYAKNIAGDGGSANQITVTFDQVAAAPDVRVLEYSGLDTTSPLDTAAGRFGNGVLADTGTCVTTAPVELIVAGATVAFVVSGPGGGFNLVDFTEPNGDGAEHQMTQVAGSCQATTVLTGGDWVTQVAAFKAVPGPVPDFTISALPTSQTVVAGNPASYTVTVTAVNGFSNPVALTCAALSLPAGTNCAFTPSSVTPGASAATSVLTLSTTAATPAATSTVTITGTFSSLTHNTTVGLTVTPAPDFTIAATALAPASVPAGTTATSTITITPTGGFNSAVALTCAVLSLPTGASCAFVPTPVTPAGVATTSALTITTTAGTPIGSSIVTITGTSGFLTHSTTVHLTVAAAPVPDFTVAATALSPATVAAGGTATSTITIAPLSGFNRAVNLTCSITPVETRPPACSFNPTSAAGGSGTSTLTVSTTAATTASLAPQPSGIFYAMLLPIAGLALLGTGITSRRKKFWSFFLGCLIFSGLIFLAACGGSSPSGGGGHPGTPAGTYTVTVTGTSGSLTHSQTVTLLVQ